MNGTEDGPSGKARKRLHICLVTQQLGQVVSGIGVHAANLARGLCEQGHRVTVVAPSDQKTDGEPGYRFVGVPRPWLAGSHARWLSLSLSFARTLRRLQAEERFDLAHFTDARESLFTRLDIPLVGNANDTYSAELQSFSYYRRYYGDWLQRRVYYQFVHLCERQALPHLQTVLANSQFTAKTILQRYPLDPKRVHVVHKSIDAGRFQAAIELRQSLPPHPPRILFVGGNMQRKGLPGLIQAAPRVLQVFPQAEFWVAGQDAAAEKMKALCESLGVARSFYFWGLVSQPKLPEFYAQGDIFVLPSLTEAFGIVFLEAMASGLPVIGTRAGGIPEIITDGIDGLLVMPDDAPGLAEAMFKVLTNPDLKTHFSQAGLARAGKFSVERMLRETVAVYQELLG